jgi:hypothetical protein
MFPAHSVERPAVAGFRFDATPPLGHPLCGGWIKPAERIDDPLDGLGFVIVGAGAPMVVVALDWTGLLNSTHLEFRRRIAVAVGATPERVAIQCVHQHNAPFVCDSADALVAKTRKPGAMAFGEFVARIAESAARAAAQALARAEPFTQVAFGQAKVEKVAANRRLLDANGKLVDWRGSSSKNPKHHAAPEGTVDPLLRTAAFYVGGKPKVACHYYACHPMSYYGDGRVNADFVGAARRRIQAMDRDCLHLYFTGCAGNVAAGKYNDGTPAARSALTERMTAAMTASLESLTPEPVTSVGWTHAEFLPTANPTLARGRLQGMVDDPNGATANRHRSAFMLAWLDRIASQTPVPISALHANDVSLVHYPAEAFVEYQLRLQSEFPNRRIAVAAYGDGGPWYIPVKSAFPQGGYEVNMAFADANCDDLLSAAGRRLFDGG